MTKYYYFWKFGDGRLRRLNFGTTSADTCFYSWTAVAPWDWKVLDEAEWLECQEGMCGFEGVRCQDSGLEIQGGS